MKLHYYVLFIVLFFHHLYAKTPLTPEEQAYIKQNPIVHVGGEMDWPPYDFVENGQHKGIIKDYLDYISLQTGLKFNIKTGYTWSELLNMAKNGQIDLLPVLIQTKQREEFLNFTQQYIKSREYVFVLDHQNNINRIEDLFGKKVAIPKGYAAINIIKNNYPKIQILESKNPLNSLDMLVTGKVDAIIQNYAISSYLIKEHNINTVKAVFNVDILNRDLHMGIRKSDEILRNILQKALADISLEQKNKIVSRWITKDKPELITLTKREKRYLLQNPIIKVANQTNWAPYSFYNNEMAQGYLIDYMKLIGTKLGIDFEFISNTLPLLEKDIKAQKIDIVPGIIPHSKYQDILNFSRSPFSLNHALVVRKSQRNVHNIEDLALKKVALKKGDGLYEALKEYYPKLQIQLYNSSEEIIDAIAFGDVDASIVDFTVAHYFIGKKLFNNLSVIKKVNIPSFDQNIYIGTRKDQPILNELIQKAMDDISPSQLTLLNKKWINYETKNNDVLSQKEKEYLKNRHFKVTSTDNWAPFNFLDKNNNYGITLDYWELLSQKGNFKYDVNLQEHFPDVLNSIKSKEFDILLGTSQTPQKEQYGLFTDTFQSFPIAIAAKDKSHFLPNARSLVGKKVAVGKGFTAYEILKKYHPNIDFVFTKNTPEALKLLSSNKVDAVVDIAPTLIHYINHLALSDLKIAGHTEYNINLKFMVRDDYQELIPILNKLIKTITPLEKQQIYDKWIRVNYQKGFDYTLFWQIIFLFAIAILVVIYRHQQLLKYQKIIQAKNETLEKQKQELEESHEIIQNTQKSLENSLHNFTTLVDSTLEAIIIVATGRIIYVNDEAVKLFKEESKETLTSKNILELFIEECKEQLLEISVTCSIQGHELIAKTATNETFPTMIKTKDIKFENMDAKIISVVDLTDVKNREKMLQEQSKMASMGEMIGNIAHQWRQPLSIISTSASGIKMSKDLGKLKDDIFDRSIQNILNNTEFLSQTIDDFKNFILQNKELVQFDLEHLVNKTLVLIEASLKENSIEYLTDVQKDVSLFNYENELNQALINIINNSKDALKLREDEERFVFIKAYKENENAVIKIRDNGGGIDENILSKVFEPYITTKHKSMGAGLGLYMTHKLIQESIQGSIYAENISFVYKEKNYTGVEVCVTIPLFKKTVRKETDRLIIDQEI